MVVDTSAFPVSTLGETGLLSKRSPTRLPALKTAPQSLRVDFTGSLGQSWAVSFARFTNRNTSDVLATRSADGLSWTLESFPGDVAVLIQKGKYSQTITGYFYMPTQLTIHAQ